MRHFPIGRRLVCAAVGVAAVALLDRGGLQAQSAPTQPERAASVVIAEADLREWLTHLSSDVMAGRAAFTEGYGLAAAYVAGQLERFGVEPLGADGTFLRPVVRTAYRVTRNSTITVTRAGTSRTFRHGEHVSFPALAGAPQRLTFTAVDFVGYGLPDPGAARPAPDGGTRLALLMPGTPTAASQNGKWPYDRALLSVGGRADALVAAGTRGAIGYSSIPSSRPSPGNEQRGRSAAPDLTTVRRVDRPMPPSLLADEEFFRFVLAGAPVPFDDLRNRASRGESLERFSLDDVEVTIEIDHVYEPLTTERTNNVVGVVRGSDPALAGTYVLFGAHLDHVGTANGRRAPGRTNAPVEDDPIWNGADDDGSGSSAVLAIAKALAQGPRPRRSTVFVWHAGEEDGLIGSEALVDDPPVPLDRISAVLNIDMIGRNRDDNPGDANTVYVIGADRISTDLHNAIVETNSRAERPLSLDYFYNDPDDSESFYTRSDHYTYASHGIPIAFFFTGPHPDYHANTDTVDRILFPKLTRIVQLIYETGFRLADSAVELRRDHLGPRAGVGFSGLIPAP